LAAEGKLSSRKKATCEFGMRVAFLFRGCRALCWY